MATSALSILRKNNNKSILNKGQTVSEGVVAPVQEPVQEEREHNTNGLIGGLGYLGEKVGLGFLQGVEGIWDFTAGGIASLTGNDDWAKKQFDNDWVNYNHADEWYNPSSGWKFAGDIAGGIGTSLPSIGAGLATIGIGAAITAASGGTGLPAYIGTIATIMSAAAGGLSAAGNATKEAYQKTGELGIKEYAYGTAMGGIEAGLELATAGIGAGTGRIIKEIGESVAGSTAKKVATSVGKETFVKTILKNGIKDFAGEAFEEGVNTAIAPYIQRATYDPTAENATVQDIMYSSVVGGFSGLLMGGANTAVSTGKSLATGNRLTQNSLANTVLEMGREISTAEDQYSTGYESFANVKKLYNELSESIKSTNGQVQTVKQKILLGELNNQATAAIMEPMVERSAMKILSNPEVTAERVSAYLTKASGQKVEITAQDLMANIDTSSQENYVKSLRKALSSNQKLIALAVADATGTMMLDTKAFEEATLQGKNFATQDDFNRFLETAKKDELKSVGEALGIEKWEGITYAEFQEKMGEFSANGNLASSIEQTKRINEAKNIPEAQAKNKIPSAFSMKEDGAIRYAEGNVDIAVIKQGDKYFVYDYVDGNITRSLSRTELNSLLNQVKEHNISFEQARTQRESEMSKLAKNFDTYCNDNIKDYRSLTEPKRGMIRAIIRDAKAKGISDADALTYARVSARTGIEIEFNKEALKLGKIKGTKELVYADGVYDGKQNKIIVNPETKRTHESLLLHELTHAINKDREGRLVLLEGVKNMSTEEKQDIIKRYMESGRDGVIELIDELDAHYVEGQLSNKNLLEKLLADKPTLKDKVLSFFKKVMGDSEDVKLSSKAKSLFNRYKKLFDSFSQRVENKGAIADKRFALPYDDAIDKLEDGTLDTTQNTHLRVLEHTPQIYIDKAGASDREIVMSWDIAYLAMNKSGTLSGNYHGLGAEIMKALPAALEDPLYIVKQKNGRIAAVTRIVVKGKRAVFASIELEAYQTTIQEGETEAKKYNLVVTVTDAKPNYLQNTIFSGEIVHNKNSEDPAHFILRLKSLEKAVPTYDLAGSSNNSITQPDPKVNKKTKKSFALPQIDKEYATAVKSNDVEKMQKLVDEVAKKAGYTIKSYHGTLAKDFTEFKKSFIGSRFNYDDKGFFFIDRKSIAEDYASSEFDSSKKGRVLDVYLRVKKPLLVNKQFCLREGLGNPFRDDDAIGVWDAYLEFFKEKAESIRADGIILDDGMSKMTVVFDSEQIKSAEPITYDDAGKIIPLSRRFNPYNRDIRFALPSTDSQGNTLSAEQIEYFKDSKVRDESGKLLVLYHGTNVEFYTFKNEKIQTSHLGEGFYFVDNKKIADSFASRRTQERGGKERVIEAYIKAEKPFDVGNITEEQIRDFLIYDYEARGRTRYSYRKKHGLGSPEAQQYAEEMMNDEDVILENGKKDYSILFSVNEDNFQNWFKENGYDCLIVPGEDSKTGIEGKAYVLFKPEQIKSIDNKKPTSNPDIRYAIPDDVKAPLDMTDSIKLGAPSQYKAGFKDKLFSAKTSAVIDFIDEMHGAEIFLKRSGVENAEATINMMRVATSQAQTMTGSVQYDIYGDKKKIGDGIQKIIAPIEKQGKETYTAFNEYLLHLHNIDRMTLESRTRAWNEESKKKLESKQLEYSLKEKAIETADKNISKLKAAKKKLTRKKADMAKREKYNSEIEKSIEQKEKIKKEMVVLGREIKKLQSEVDNFIPMENKPVFGVNEARGRSEAITAEQSQERANTLEKQYPEFKEKAEEVHRYFKNLLHMDVQTGKITSEQEEYMNKLYPRYVPTIRDGKQPGVKPVKGKHDYKVNTDIKTAIGGGEDVLEIAYSGASRTQQVIRSGNVNLLAQKIYEAHLSTGDNTYVEVVSTKKMTPEEIADINYDDASMRPKNNQVTFFYNGEYITMKVSKEIFAAFEALDNPSIDFNSTIMKGINKVNKIYKTLVTSYSPAFILRNPIRDLQDAGLNSKNPVEFAKNLPLAYKEIASNGKYWELYRAMGGFSSSVFDTQKGFTSKVGKRGLSSIEKNTKGIIKSPFTMIENANVVVEQATRLAEFMASLKKGNTAEQALLDSAEVTTNFGRKGKLAKKLNATVMPFLNPAIQGADKIYRNVKDAFVSKNKAKAFALLITKAALIGIVPHVLNMLMYKDDEDYEILDETVKENYYLFKVGDKFIRIPKGRLVSVLAGAANRITLMARGKDPDIKSYLKNISTQITPVDSMSRTIFSPFVDVATNTTWYGSAIEGRQFENTAPRDRYDESTSSIAIVIGQAINYSPKKIHYLLDQYSGVIGDFILPATTKKAEKDYISNSFVTDPVVSNKLSSEFYKLYDQAQYGKTAGDDKSTYYVKYLNETKSAVNKVYKEISEIQNSNLSSAEKLQQTRVLRIAINNMYKSAINDYEIVGAAIEATAGVDEKFRYTEIVHLVYGAERALETYDDKVYEKCSLFNNAGIDYETLYYYYFSTLGLESDVDNEGNTIAGSKRGKIIEIINSLNVSDEEKLLLLCYRGYSIKDGDIKGLTKESALVKLAKRLKSAKTLNNEQKEKLAELCGLKYKNGKIIVPASYKWRKNNKSSVLSLIKGG